MTFRDSYNLFSQSTDLLSYIGKHNRNVFKVQAFLNRDWKAKALSDDREIPYERILCFMITGAQLLTCIIGCGYNTQGSGI